MTRIVVRTPVAPVLAEQRAASTQTNQLLYGHSAEVISAEGSWLRLRGPDGYEGWMHEGYTVRSAADGPSEWAWDIEGELSKLPGDWPVTDSELDAVADFVDYRRGPVAARLRAVVA